MLQIALWKRIVIWGLCAFGLLLAMPNGFYPVVERYNDATAAKEAGKEPGDGYEIDDLTAWPSYLPSGLVNLGLDLRGGVHLLAEVQVEEVYADNIELLWSEVRDVLRTERDIVGGIRRIDSAPHELRIRIGQPEGMNHALGLVRPLAQPVISLTGVGQNDLEFSSDADVLTVTLSAAEMASIEERTMAQSLEIVRRRIDAAGTREPSIQRQGADRILIQVPGLGSAQELIDLIGSTAKLEFRHVVRQAGSLDVPAGVGNEVLPSTDGTGFYVVSKVPVVTGEELKNAQPAFDTNGAPAVNFTFNASGARKFGVYTAENIGAPFAIVLDSEVISAPTIQSHIGGGTGIITGQFTVEETTNLAIVLRSGALPASLDFLEQRSVGPDLGADSIEAGKIACIVAFIAVLLFMLLSYGQFGLFANIALIINVGLIFGLLSLLGATLTLPGIAGIVLTIGMAVDANVLIFERIREELKAARGPARSIELGYEKALSAIVDANITTFITAVILFAMGSGPVKGFAITLGLGILTSVFTAIFVTRLIVVIWFEWRKPKTIEV